MFKCDGETFSKITMPQWCLCLFLLVWHYHWISLLWIVPHTQKLCQKICVKQPVITLHISKQGTCMNYNTLHFFECVCSVLEELILSLSPERNLKFVIIVSLILCMWFNTHVQLIKLCWLCVLLYKYLLFYLYIGSQQSLLIWLLYYVICNCPFFHLSIFLTCCC